MTTRADRGLAPEARSGEVHADLAAAAGAPGEPQGRAVAGAPAPPRPAQLDDEAVDDRAPVHERVDTASAGPTPRYFARQLSDLDFNDRLLDLAEDSSVPLLERVKFAALFNERLDEFFQVQVAGLKRQMAAGIKARALNGSTPRELLADVRASLERMVRRHERLLHDSLLPALADEGVSLCTWDELGPDDRAHLSEVFDRLILPVVTPLTVDPSHPFPYLSNLSLNVGVDVRDGEVTRFARVKVPPNVPRLLRLPDGDRFVPIERVMMAHLGEIFPGADVGEAGVFRVTRDADIALDDDAADDLLLALQEELRRRRFLPVVRLEVDTTTSDANVERLTGELGLDPTDVSRVAGPLGREWLWALYELDRPRLHDSPWSPLVPQALVEREPDERDGIFAVLGNQDVLVHHPYDSFAASVEELINEAADDPQVLAIKQCLYRTSGDSPVVAALVRAAEHGKQVAVLVEVTARFDEEANIGWARALEEAGAHVVYGLMGLKTHAKTTLVVRQEGEEVRRYCHVGTGNYNPKTARIYEDLGVLSSRASLGDDVTRFFNYITGFSRPPEYRELVTAPGGIRERILAAIAEQAALGAGGRIVLKVNGLDDQAVIDALYRASQAGVPIDLVVRGICCLAPGVPGLSETVRVRSIVGRFLEHSRIFRFGGGAGEATYYIGSADLRRRNLDRRVEAMIPVTDADAVARLEEILTLELADDTHAWSLAPDGRWSRVPTVTGVDAQRALGAAALARSVPHDEERARAAQAPAPEARSPDAFSWRRRQFAPARRRSAWGRRREL
ncbi:MAG: polyphosphate kinase 1 [Actinomycetota bacterium]|jgi:polyphosphate kinase|nr:polyphosphate kinase 1 [Actinomycetota bacterium]